MRCDNCRRLKARDRAILRQKRLADQSAEKCNYFAEMLAHERDARADDRAYYRKGKVVFAVIYACGFLLGSLLTKLFLLLQ